MVFFFLPVGSILRAGRALSNTKSKASNAVDKAFGDSNDSNSPTAPPPPPPNTAYTAPDGSAVVSRWKPRLLAREDGIEVDPRDVHLVATAAGIPPSPRTAVHTDDIELHEKKSESDAETAAPAAVASSSEPYYLYYRLLNSDSSVFYTSRLKVGDNHPDIGCQLCAPDEKEQCPCLTSCGFDIRFDANINTISVVAPPSATAPPPPPPVNGGNKGGIKGFMANVARMANETVLAERIQSQEINIAYQQSEPRPDHPPTHQIMDLNAVKPFHFYSEHHDCCCVLVYVHILTKVQKNVGMQVVAMPKEEGDALASKCTWYSCTAC